MCDVDEILWTGKSELEKICSIKELHETHIVLETDGSIPEMGVRGIVWLPFFRIFPAVISEVSGSTFTARFEDLDSVMKRDLDYFIDARKTKVKRNRPKLFIRALLRTVYLLEQRLSGIEHRTFPLQQFPWSLEFEKQYSSIHNEVMKLFNNVGVENIPLGPDQVPKFHAVNIAQQGKVDANAKKVFPITSQLVENVPSLANAQLSILAPGADLRMHKAASRCFLRMHLGIIIPKGDVCLELEGEKLKWKEGKVMIFDDFYHHRAWNKTEHTRVILMVDLFRPMPKWQELFFRFVQKKIIQPLQRIPNTWMSWEN